MPNNGNIVKNKKMETKIVGSAGIHFRFVAITILWNFKFFIICISPFINLDIIGKLKNSIISILWNIIGADKKHVNGLVAKIFWWEKKKYSFFKNKNEILYKTMGRKRIAFDKKKQSLYDKIDYLRKSDIK